MGVFFVFFLAGGGGGLGVESLGSRGSWVWALQGYCWSFASWPSVGCKMQRRMRLLCLGLRGFRFRVRVLDRM